MAFEYQPRLAEKDYDAFMESYHDLIRARRGGTLSQDDYVTRKNELHRDLESVMNPDDMRFFQDIDGLKAILGQIMPEDDANKLTEHELEHGTKAEALGYTVQYGVWLMQGYSGNLVTVPFTHVMQESNSQHLDQIKGAANHQSVYD